MADRRAASQQKHITNGGGACLAKRQVGGRPGFSVNRGT